MEELATANNRTLSEQVEYYVDSGVFTEAKLIYEYSTDAMSPTLYRCISSRDVRKEEPHLDLDFPKAHREMLTIAGTNHLNTAKGSSMVPWVKEPGGESAAIDMARALLDGIVRGALDSFDEMVGPSVVAALQSDGAIGLSSINIKTNRDFHRLETRCIEAEAEVERLRKEISTLDANKSIADNKNKTSSVIRSFDPNGDFSIAALSALVDQFRDDCPDFGPLRDARWPKRFKDLPSETRDVLTDKLGDEANLIYEALMVPVRSHPAVLRKGSKPSRVDFDRITIVRALRCIQSAVADNAKSGDAVRETEARRA